MVTPDAAFLIHYLCTLNSGFPLPITLLDFSLIFHFNVSESNKRRTSTSYYIETHRAASFIAYLFLRHFL